MKLHDDPFDLIEREVKTFELRLYDEKRQFINVGDEIVFSCRSDPDRTVSVTVTSLNVFKTFEELYEQLPLLKCGYTAETLSKAKPDDMSKYYSSEEEKRFGVVGIGIKKLNCI